MNEDEVRFYLLKNYEEKSNQHIKNIYAIAATAFGILLSGILEITPEKTNLNLTELGIIFLFPFLYFLLRALYWNARISLLKKIKLDVEPSSTLIREVEHSVSKEIGEYKGGFSLVFRATNKYLVKFLFWLILPGSFYVLFFYGCISL